MIIVLKPHASAEVVDHVLERITALGFTPHLSQGVSRTIIGVIGDEAKLQVEPLQAIPGVEQVVPILQPFKLASREFHPEGSVFEIKGVKIGGGHLAVIAGPCAIESESLLFEIAGRVRDAGANILRSGRVQAPDQPLQLPGARPRRAQDPPGRRRTVRHAGRDRSHGPAPGRDVERYADILQIGAATCRTSTCSRSAAAPGSRSCSKRGMSATVKDLLMSAEYVLSEGNRQVILCERGIRTFEDSTRNTLDLSIVPNIQGQSHLPIIVDPSHATGRPDLIPAMARAAIAAGCDGIHIEVHSCPERALSDGPQALVPDQFDRLMDEIRQLAELLGKSIDVCKGEPATCAPC